MKQIMLLAGCLWVVAQAGFGSPTPTPNPTHTPTPTPIPEEHLVKEPLPGGVLLANPASAHWHVTSSVPPSLALHPVVGGTKKTPSPTPKPASLRVMQTIEITKTNDLVHEHSVDADGIAADTWYKGTIGFLVLGENPSKLARGGADYKDYAHLDFPELAFVNPSTYSGTLYYHKQKCLVFTGKPHINPEPGESQKEANARAPLVSVYVDDKSRLPVITKMGSVVNLYQFDPPPTEALVFPSPLQDLLDTEQQEQNHITTPHGSAFVP